MPNPNPLEIPAVVATQVSLAVTENGWRLSFGEQSTEQEATYHLAVFLPTATARQLIELMVSTAKKQTNADPQ